MNVRAHAARNDAHLAARSFLGTMLLTALMLMLSVTLAGAETNSSGQHPQNQFTSECRALGGKPKRDATHIVTCTWPDGAKWTCDFNSAPPVCTYTPKPKPASSTNGTVVVGSAAPDATIVQADSGGASTNDAGSGGNNVITASSQSDVPMFTADDDD